MKRCTDINQSRKLAKILRLESADMCYLNDGTAIKVDATSYNATVTLWSEWYTDIIPCWSLAALLGAIPDVSLNAFKDGIWNAMVIHDSKTIYVDKDNPVDACVELIIKLNELGIL